MSRVHNPAALKHLARHTRKRSVLSTDMLLQALNYVTAPNVLRDDTEHATCRRYSRAIQKRLAKHRVVIVEDDNGRFDLKTY